MTTNTTPPPAIVILLPVIIVAGLLAVAILYMRRQGYSKGGGDNIVVRCNAGHLFTTIWIPFMSFKAIRLGPKRYQHCPVGNHWALVMPIDPETLTKAELKFAAEHHDRHIP